METEQEHHSVEQVHLQGPAELIAHLRQTVNNSAFSDVVFICNDGKRVQALRMLLAGRSEVLRSRVLNGMAETKLSEIEFPLISSRALLSILEFLYTGTLLDYRPQSWTIGCELILASRIFILPTLENVIRIFMLEQISSVAEDQTKAASLLTEALGCGGLCDEKDTFLVELVRILSSDWTKSVYVQSLSADALHYLLSNSKGNREIYNGCFSLREYNRFMQVMLWWRYKSDLKLLKEQLVKFIPQAEDTAMSLYKDRYNSVIVKSPPKDAPCAFNELDLSKLEDSSKISVLSLLSHIEWWRIHPILLSKVVEPLNLISDAELLNLFRFHALQRDSYLSSYSEYVWHHAEFCAPLEEGLGIKRAASKIGLAVMKQAVSRSCIFGLTELCGDFVELGFFTYSSKVGADKPAFDGKRLSDQDHALVLKFHETHVSVKLEGPLGRVNWKLLETYSSFKKFEGVVVELMYNGSQHNCSLSIGKCDFGVIWKNLPRRLFYPAVSFGNSEKGIIGVAHSDS